MKKEASKNPIRSGLKGKANPSGADRVRRRAVSSKPAIISAADATNTSSAPSELQQVYEAIPHLRTLRDEVLYGDVWKRPELPPQLRSLVTCAILAALGRQDELRAHVGRAVDNGVTPDELRGLAVHVAFYAGWPAALAVGRAALPFLS